MTLPKLYKRLLEINPKISKFLDSISQDILEEYDERPYKFLILYDYYTAKDLAESLQEVLDPYGRSFPLPPEDIEVLSDSDIISLTSKTNKEQFLNECLREYGIFPKDIGLKELEEEIENAVDQSEIVIPIITPQFLTSEKNLDLLKKLENKRIVNCIYKGYIGTEKMVEMLTEPYKKLLKHRIEFSSNKDLTSKVKEYISSNI